MKIILSNNKIIFIFGGVSVLLFVLLFYMITRPISYGMKYYVYEVYEGYEFESTMIFHKNDKMTIINSNFDEPQDAYYYYKDGYFILCYAQTEEEYVKEVEQINADYEAALCIPFYASEINPFFYRNVNILDGMDSIYVCNEAKVIVMMGCIAL